MHPPDMNGLALDNVVLLLMPISCKVHLSVEEQTTKWQLFIKMCHTSFCYVNDISVRRMLHESLIFENEYFGSLKSIKTWLTSRSC